VEILATWAIGIITYSKGDKELVKPWWIFDEFMMNFWQKLWVGGVYTSFKLLWCKYGAQPQNNIRRRAGKPLDICADTLRLSSFRVVDLKYPRSPL
jgi:hypothetical protein